MVDLKKLREKYDSLNKDGGDFYENFFQLKEGEEASVRFMPWDRDERDFFSESAIHRIDGKNLHCPAVAGKDCPICKAYRKIWDKINRIGKDTPEGKRLQELARGIKANPRYYMNAIDRRSGKVKIISAGKKLFLKILGSFADADYGDLTQLKNGWDYKIVRKNLGGFPNYDDSAPRPNRLDAGSESEIATWLDELHDIHALIKLPEYDTLNNIAKEALSLLNDSPGGEEDVAASDSHTGDEGQEDGEDYLARLKQQS